MELFKDEHDDLKDTDPSIKFCRRIKKLISVMNGRTPLEKLVPGNEHWQRFFGLMRERERAAEQIDHPDSSVFIQMFRLVSTYSLVKPAKGCNVTKGGMMDALLKLNDIADKKVRQLQWNKKIDHIMENEQGAPILESRPEILEQNNFYMNNSSAYAVAYVAGYVARQASERFVKFLNNGQPFVCQNCIATLNLALCETISNSHKLITIKTKGFLKYPSIQLCDLVGLLERTCVAVSQKQGVHSELNITNEIENLYPLPKVGCKDHKIQVTRSIVRFFLTFRMLSIAKQSNKRDNIEREKTKEKRKLAILSYSNSV
ncbi:uncharacterized protein LOC117177866 [Belonocnema kinseyi]|uniref:uncharacterized protein LOC117177866 n=1 Tax=Belonocnema kinseyi TaxID=2817044 RepID=UPI00143E0B96|nr:uncharacterized protein LOC117177866 [Belonocnema kinseyi]XP_033224795.1 uncharacterized protein LOC117177866 [Belonocnema kinseyi]